VGNTKGNQKHKNIFLFKKNVYLGDKKCPTEVCGAIEQTLYGL